MTGRGTDIDGLLERLRNRSAGRRRAAPAPAPQPATPDPFATLAEVRAVELQLDALDSLGLAMPYHRLAHGPPGAEVQMAGHPVVTFASYDYLGLNTHPEVAAAATRALSREGVSAMASRLCGGERQIHRQLEARLAEMQGTEAALAFVSGHATNMSTIAALVGPGDLIVHDALCHNSIVEGARLSGATRVAMPHNDLDWLEHRLAAARADHRRALVVVEGLYSMDGDTPDLARLVEIKDRHGAWAMVDEAHALGTLGPTGRGLAEAQGVRPARVEVWMGTLSKALAACGGYICGSAALITLLKARAPGFVYSVALPPALAAAADAALEIMARAPERVARVQANGRMFLEGARARGLDTGHSEGHAIVPIVVGDSIGAVRASQELLELGIAAMPIVHPAVPERAARLRFFLTALHTPAHIEAALDATARVLSAGLGPRADDCAEGAPTPAERPS